MPGYNTEADYENAIIELFKTIWAMSMFMAQMWNGTLRARSMILYWRSLCIV